jgi:hypothetical protein
MKLNVSMSSANVAGEFTMFLFNVRTMSHIMHINSRSYSSHEALGDFYDKLLDLTDRFAESAIGHYQGIIWPNVLSDGMVPVQDLDPIPYLRNVQSIVTRTSDLVDKEDLKNIVAEILELVSSTLYKLTQLK